MVVEREARDADEDRIPLFEAISVAIPRVAPLACLHLHMTWLDLHVLIDEGFLPDLLILWSHLGDAHNLEAMSRVPKIDHNRIVEPALPMQVEQSIFIPNMIHA